MILPATSPSDRSGTTRLPFPSLWYDASACAAVIRYMLFANLRQSDEANAGPGSRQDGGPRIKAAVVLVWRHSRLIPSSRSPFLHTLEG